MTTATVTAHCAHCGREFPNGTYQSAEQERKAWSVHDVPHNDGTIRTVAVCPPCRFGSGPSEQHEPGTCSGRYTAADAYIAECKEWRCKGRWACWIKECVEEWQEEHYEEHDECGDCNGHHNTKLIAPKQPRP